MKNIHKNQQGLTFIEMVIGILIFGMISVAVTSTLIQVVKVSAKSNNHLQAIREAQAVGYWVSQDVQSATSIPTPVETPRAGVKWEMTLSWSNPFEHMNVGEQTHQILYTLYENDSVHPDGEVVRQDTFNGVTSELHIASSIQTLSWVNYETDPGVRTAGKLRITAVVGGFQQATEIRDYTMETRDDPGGA